MKTKKLLGIFFLFLCTITLVSCGDDEKQEIYSLSFEKGYYERPLLGAKNIPVRGGNRDYTVTCLLYTSPSPRDVEESRMPSSA